MNEPIIFEIEINFYWTIHSDSDKKMSTEKKKIQLTLEMDKDIKPFFNVNASIDKKKYLNFKLNNIT